MASTGITRDEGGTLPLPRFRLGRRRADSLELRAFLESAFRTFPWRIVITDWTGQRYPLGGDQPHWYGQALDVHIRTPRAGGQLLGMDGLGFLERFLEGEVDLSGNLYLMSEIRSHARLPLRPMHALAALLKNTAFQNASRARVSVKSHYDIPQEALHHYLDRKYMSYSCAMWEDPDDLSLDDLLREGSDAPGTDPADSLEKAQWRKFKDAVDFLAPAPGETLLDIGCGYGGQLAVALEQHPFGKAVGWTHSSNQASEGRRRVLAHLDAGSWELHEGDYRQEERVFDHVASTGMVSHVGPRGLEPYVRNVRRRIKTGGRYLHHALMTYHTRLPIDLNPGIAFNKKYVWPGFHWFTLGEHVRALEKNGFQIERVRNLTFHYAKTTASWHERFMARREVMVKNLGEPTARAWQVFLAGITGAFLARRTHVYRLYCTATAA